MSDENETATPTKEIEYPLPDEVNNLFLESIAMTELRDQYIARPFGFKKAAKAARLAGIASGKAWEMFRNLYPDAPKKLVWRYDRQVVVENKEQP